jgi:hypothetical protein
MKLKTAFALSLIVNAMFLMAVGVLLVTDIEPAPTPPLVRIGTNAPASVASSMVVAQ